MCLNPLLDPNIPSHNPCELKSTSATAESSQFFVNRQISNPFHFTPQKDDFYLPSYKIEFWRNDERWNFETTFISVPERQIYLLDTFFHNFDISFGGRTKIKSKIPKTFHFAPTHLMGLPEANMQLSENCILGAKLAIFEYDVTPKTLP